MPGENGQISPSATIRAARCAGSRPHLASGFRGSWKIATIRAGLGVIWGMSVSIMKRGIHGVYHHVSQQHLKRYLAEFDFLYNERSALGVNDAARMAKSVTGIVGKRLYYH